MQRERQSGSRQPERTPNSPDAATAASLQPSADLADAEPPVSASASADQQ